MKALPQPWRIEDMSVESQEKEKLKLQLHRELLDLCDRTYSETQKKYNPNDFRKMVLRIGGFAATKQLLQPPVFPFHDGLARLFELGRLDLSLEEFVMQEPWRSLLKSEGMLVELNVALQRLGKKPVEKI